MSFESVHGQAHAKDVLRRAIRSDRVPHALLMTGPPGVGKAALALALARAVNCLAGEVEPCDACASCHRVQSLTHPDVHIVFPAKKSPRDTEDVDPEEEQRFLSSLGQSPYLYPEPGAGQSILIDRIRRLQRDLARSLFEGRCRVGILLHADRLGPQSGNAILKTLEEPIPRTLLILVTSRPDSLLPTIISRCQVLRLRPLTKPEIRNALRQVPALPDDRAAQIVNLSQGSLRRAYQLAGEVVGDFRDQAYFFLREGVLGEDVALIPFAQKWSAPSERKHIEPFFEAVSTWLRDVVLLQEGCAEQLVNLDRKEDVERLGSALNTEVVSNTLAELERCRDMCRRNVNLSLILISLWRSMRRYALAG